MTKFGDQVVKKPVFVDHLATSNPLVLRVFYTLRYFDNFIYFTSHAISISSRAVFLAMILLYVLYWVLKFWDVGLQNMTNID